MFHVIKIQQGLRKLCQENLTTTEFDKKITSVESFVHWLKEKAFITEDDVNKIKRTIVEVRKVRTVKNVPNFNKTKDTYFIESTSLIDKNTNASESVSNVNETTSLSGTVDVRSEISNDSIQRGETSNIHSTYPKHHLSPIYITVFIIGVISVIGFGIFYNNTYTKKTNGEVLAAQSSGRVLNYKGVLKETKVGAVDRKIDVIFRLYDNSVGGNPLYVGRCEGENAVEPLVNGSFTVVIGSDCGMKRIPESVFQNSSDLYLGLTFGTDKEMSPRQKIAKVGYAVQADKLKGMTLGTTPLSIPYIDEAGRLLIDATSPVLKASAGDFTIEGQAITLQATAETDSSIILDTPANGNVIVTNGNMGIGTLMPTTKLDVSGSASISGSLALTGYTSQINQLNGGNLTFATSDGGEEGLRSRMTLTYDGKLGIGTVLPHFLVSALENKGGGNIASFSNTSTNDDKQTSVMRLNLGTNTSGTNSQFIQFFAGSNADDNGTMVGKIRLNKNNVAYETGGADFAEYFEVKEQIEPGYIMSLVNGLAQKASRSQKLMGVVSDEAGFIGNAKQKKQEDKQSIIGLVGQIETWISTVNGPIKAGDAITVGNLKGIGEKAKNAGYVIGEAIEESDSLSTTQLKNELCPVDYRHVRDMNGQLIRCGKIAVLIQPTWYEPRIYLTDDGNISINSNYELKAGNTQLERVENFARIFVGKIKAGLVETQGVFAGYIQTISLKAEHILADKITSKHVISPLIETEQLQAKQVTTNAIKTDNSDLEIDLNTKKSDGKFAELMIKGLEGNTVSSFDVNGNATFSGQVESESLKAEEIAAQTATIAGTLSAKEVVAENITSLEGTVNSLQNSLQNNVTDTSGLKEISEELSNQMNKIQELLGELKNETIPDVTSYPQISEDIQIPSIGGLTSSPISTNESKLALSSPQQIFEDVVITDKANIYNLYVSNSINTGNLLLQDNTIKSLTWNLNLSSLSTVNFFEQAVIIDKTGSLFTSGQITAKGGIKTNVLEPIENSVNVKFSSDEGALKITNSSNREVASIASTGQAHFVGLSVDKYLSATSPAAVITPSENLSRNGIAAPGLETANTTAGIGVVPENSSEIVVFNNTLTEGSLVYLTQTSVDTKQTIAVVKKESCKMGGEVKCKPYFKVAVSEPQTTPLYFNWLLIN